MDVIPLTTASPENPGESTTEVAGAAATCAGCGAPLAPDQRYCLACGRPASPVRLAFLDVLQGEYGGAQAGREPLAGLPRYAGYTTPAEPEGLLGGLRRYSGLLGLITVLLAALLIGLLVGHWITGGASNGSSAGKQVIEVKGLSGLAAAAPVATGAAASTSATASEKPNSAKSSEGHGAAKEEAEEVKEVKAAKAPPPVKQKTSSASLQKLNKTTGKQHEREINKLISGDQPIETGH